MTTPNTRVMVSRSTRKGSVVFNGECEFYKAVRDETCQAGLGRCPYDGDNTCCDTYKINEAMQRNQARKEHEHAPKTFSERYGEWRPAHKKSRKP